MAKHRMSCAFPYRAAFYSLSRCADQGALLADPDKWNQIADIFAGKIINALRSVIQEENASEAAAKVCSGGLGGCNVPLRWICPYSVFVSLNPLPTGWTPTSVSKVK
jgi:hypothetical protein